MFDIFNDMQVCASVNTFVCGPEHGCVSLGVIECVCEGGCVCVGAGVQCACVFVQ